MARVRDELLSQVEPGKFSPDYSAEQINRGAADVLARQSLPVGTVPRARPKIAAADANYTEDGTPPFICGNCRYILYDKGAPSGDLCQLVDGPYGDGHIDPADTCRLFCPKPAYGFEETGGGDQLE